MEVQPAQEVTQSAESGTHDWFVGTLNASSRASRRRPGSLTSPITCRWVTFAAGHSRCSELPLLSQRHRPRGCHYPGVGNRRKAIAVQTEKGIFVGLDNGVLS